ncbi:MAG: aminopeptidase P family protein [Halocynthiibacter sp.]
MFQTFVSQTSPENVAPRLAALRDTLHTQKVDGFIIPRTDAHQGEYCAPCDERLAWLTGFTGSAGFAVALRENAAIFVDGRYTIQVQNQTDVTAFPPQNWPATGLVDWLLEHAPEGAKIAYDPWLHSAGEINAATKNLAASGISLVPSRNLVDQIWQDRPTPPQEKAFIQPIELTGKNHDDKRRDIAGTLAEDALVLTLPDSINWLLNIRGRDIAHNPVCQCFAILHKDARIDLFVDPAKLDDALHTHLGAAVTCHPVDAFVPQLTTLSGQVLLDQRSVPMAVYAALLGGDATPVLSTDPCILSKACKTPQELQGARDAHLVDAGAMVEFLAWLDQEAPKGDLTEIDIVTALEGFRTKTGLLQEISFDTISGAGPNGAIVHYRVTEDSNRDIDQDTFLLVDSGGQYTSGTTDITRTIAIGTVSDTQKRHFTRVLQGMIAISRVAFPRGLSGRDLDALARYPLWLEGCDYDHGTGHGVGAYLSVHEGPQGIARKYEVPFQEGMILSNEPGYYVADGYGIRLENLISVTSAPERGDGRDMLSFETLTYVPIDKRAIDMSLLSADEIAWLNAYHAACWDQQEARVSGPARLWLKNATATI